MSKLSDRFAPLLNDLDAQRLLRLYEQASHEIRFIGGCVRDCLLDRPLKDIDLACTAWPDATLALLKKNNIQAIPTGVEHGTVTAVINGRHFEITTLRADVKTDGRHAEVSFTKDWQTDAERRDFTINALSLDACGVLHDYCQGLKDIESRTLRFIGDPAKRITEDYLRILRYFRFASQLNWQLSDESELAVCGKYATDISTLSRERIQAELFKLLLGDGCIATVLLMEKYGIWQAILQKPINITALQNLVDLETKHKEPDALRRLVALLNCDPVLIEKITVLSNKEKKRIDYMIRLHAQNNCLTRTLYEFGVEAVKDHAYLTNDDTQFAAIKGWHKPTLPVTASDIMPFTNGEGPLVGSVLKALENHWIDHGFQPSKEELMQRASDILDKGLVQ